MELLGRRAKKKLQPYAFLCISKLESRETGEGLLKPLGFRSIRSKMKFCLTAIF